MFEVGKAYRIFLRRGENLVPIDGTLLVASGDLLMLDVEGVQTIFHLGGASVAYVEVVDAQSEEVASEAQIEPVTTILGAA